jgi:hypothetical protein
MTRLGDVGRVVTSPGAGIRGSGVGAPCRAKPFVCVSHTIPLTLRHTGLAPPDPNRRDYVIIEDGREVGRFYEDSTDAASNVGSANMEKSKC